MKIQKDLITIATAYLDQKCFDAILELQNHPSFIEQNLNNYAVYKILQQAGIVAKQEVIAIDRPYFNALFVQHLLNQQKNYDDVAKLSKLNASTLNSLLKDTELAEQARLTFNERNRLAYANRTPEQVENRKKSVKAYDTRPENKQRAAERRALYKSKFISKAVVKERFDLTEYSEQAIKALTDFLTYKGFNLEKVTENQMTLLAKTLVTRNAHPEFSKYMVEKTSGANRRSLKRAFENLGIEEDALYSLI